jgi:hypothetical protein
MTGPAIGGAVDGGVATAPLDHPGALPAPTRAAR